MPPSWLIASAALAPVQRPRRLAISTLAPLALRFASARILIECA